MFMWIFVDQLFIQMRALKKKKGNVEIGASTLSLAYSVKNDPLRPIHSIPVSRRILKQPPPPRYVQSLPRSSGAKARRGGGGGKLSHRPSSASNTTASLHRRRATSRLQKSKSLEQILDSSSSSMSGPHYWISNGQIPSSSSSGSHRSHHKRRREIKSMAPSYCTLDRSSRIPRSSSSPPTARKREVTPPGRSVEFLDAYDEASYLPPPVIDESQPYIGDCDLSGLVPPPPLDSDTAKSVTIATEVTEYRYPDKSNRKSSVQDDLNLIQMEENSPGGPNNNNNNGSTDTWFTKLSSRSRPSYTKDQIIGLYCQDVPL